MVKSNRALTFTREDKTNRKHSKVKSWYDTGNGTSCPLLYCYRYKPVNAWQLQIICMT